nr:glycosyltransferase [Saccharibacter sp. 17.LH.SD]
MENHLRRLVGNQDDRARLRQEAAEELSAAWICQCIIAGDEAEVQLLNELGYDAVKLLPPVAVKPAWEGDREFSERHGLFFPLPIYRSGDAVHDGFDWFCLQVVPHLNDFLPADVPVWVGTYHNPAINLSFYERFVVLEGLSSPKQSREALMQQCRVMVAPTRAFATQPLEVVEGAAYGLPSVVSAPLMESLHWTDREECFNGGFNDARRFAQAIAELYQNEEFWKHVQTKARERVEKENTLARFREVFADILSLASGAAPMSFDQSLGHEQPLERRFAPAPLQCRPIGGRAHEEKKSGLVSSEEEEESEKQELPTRLGVQLSQ